eukprot:TRINITY_DN34632_c0_g2_i1.p1 TRINITY_DN34632_c0_g2~~TRINITY_DN34632_c0_g2_i1.p1  ORF type:complete len:331 (-),score=52.24 TRINITY_DN34632_c0_g2_i1:561-1553(-)
MGSPCRAICKRVLECSAAVALILGIISLGLAIWYSVLAGRRARMYSSVLCWYEAAVLKDVEPGVGIDGASATRLSLELTSVCSNPNHYDIAFASATGSETYLGPEISDDGSVTLARVPAVLTGPFEQPCDAECEADGILGQRVAVPAGSNGTAFFVNEVLIPNMFANSSWSPLEEEVPISMKLESNIFIDMPFKAFGSTGTMAPFTAYCGVRVTGLAVTAGDAPEVTIGPLACADSFARLRIPAVGGEASAPAMAPREIDVAPSELALVKNSGVTRMVMAMTVLFGLAFLCLCICGPMFYICKSGLRSSSGKESTGDRRSGEDDSYIVGV